jgi:hypothetical protein
MVNHKPFIEKSRFRRASDLLAIMQPIAARFAVCYRPGDSAFDELSRSKHDRDT